MKTKRILALFLCVAELLTLIPSATLASESEAEAQTVRIEQSVGTANPGAAITTGGKAVTHGVNSVNGYDSDSDSYNYVYYGMRDGKGVKWRVLDDETLDGNAGFFLMLENAISGVEFIGYCTVDTLDSARNNCWRYTDDKCHNWWENSTARIWCRAFTEQITPDITLGFSTNQRTLGDTLYNNNKAAYDKNYNTFSELERAKILPTTKTDKNYKGNYLYSGRNLNDEKVFFLSADEVSDANYGLDNDANRTADYIWMTRSAAGRDCVYSGDLECQYGGDGINDAGIAAIYPDGYLSDWGVYTAILDKVPGGVPKETYKFYSQTASARPGMNIGYDSIVFASAPDAAWEKPFDLLDDYSGSEWKLTLGTGDSFSADLSSNILSSDGIEVTHPALNSIGETEYNTVTAELKNTDGETVAYGALNTADTSANTGTLPLPSGLADGIYTLSLRAEQWNGQNKTNYASEEYDAGTIYVGRDNSHNGHKFTPIYSEKQLADMTADDYCFLITDITVNSDTVYTGHLCLNGFTLSGDMQVRDFALYDDENDDGAVDGSLILTGGTLDIYDGTVNGGIVLTEGKLALHGGAVNDNKDGYSVVAESGTTVTFPGKAVLNGETAGLYLKGTATVSAAGIAVPSRPYTVKLESSEGSFCTDWDETQDYVRYFSGANGYSVRCEGTVLSLIEYTHNVPAHPACGISCDHNGSHPMISDWQTLPGTETELPGGSYVLSSNIMLENKIEITGEVNLCLNGYVLSLKDDDTNLVVKDGGTLNISDCSANQTGRIDVKVTISEDYPDYRGAIVVYDNGTLRLYTGTIKNTAGSVAVLIRGGNFDMYGGTISDSEYGVNNKIKGRFDMYGGTVKACTYGVIATGDTRLYADSLVTGCTKYGVNGDRMRAVLGGTIRNCDVGFHSGTVTDGGVVENCRIGADHYVRVEQGGTIKNCTEYGVYAVELIMTGGSITGCKTGVYLNPQKAKNGVNLMTVSGAPIISGNTANVVVYSALKGDGSKESKADVQAIFVGAEGISEEAVIPVRVITIDGDSESYSPIEGYSYTFSGVYPTRDYSRYFESDVLNFRIVHSIEKNQLTFAYKNGSKRDSAGNLIYRRVLCFMQYDANGGSGSIDYSTLDDGYSENSKYYPYTSVKMADTTNGDGSLIANPFTAPAGKVFAGWNTKADGSGIPYADRDIFRYGYTTVWVFNGDTVKLYAQWVSTGGINVTFDANGGTCTTSSQSVKYGSAYGNLPTPVRENYDFIGWYTEKDGGSLVNERSMASTLSDHTLYAHWKENGFTVSFAPGIDVPGGSGTMASVSRVNGAYKLPECTYTTPSGMKFKAWEIDGKEYAPGDVITVSKNITVTAVWEDIEKTAVIIEENVQTFGYDAAEKSFVIKSNVTSGFIVKYQKDGSDIASPTNAGNYDVIIERAEDNTYKKYSKTIESGLVIAPKDINGATVGSFAAMTYNGKEQTPQAAVTIDGLTATGEWSKVKNVTDKTSFNANGNFTGTIADKSTGMLKVASKINSEPSAKSGLVYDKTPHILITNGKPDGGVMKYSSDNKATWSEELPQAVNAGSYEIWYKVIGDSNHNDTEPVKIDVSIAKASVDIPTVASKIYTGSRQTAENGETELYTVSENNGGINVGRYDVKLLLKDSANYHWNGKADDVSEITLDFGITKADNEWTTKPGIVGWTYGETANAPVYAAKFGDVKVEYKKSDGEDSTYTTTAPTNAGDYKVRFTVAATDDFGGLSDVIDLNIARANVAVTAPTAKENLVYTGFAQLLTAGGSTDGGEIRYSGSKDGAYSAEVITGTNAGSYEIWYKVIGDSNHNDTEPVKIDVSIAKASVDIPTVASKIYTGSRQTAENRETELYTVSENNGGTNVGRYDVKLLLKDSANYHWNGKADDVSEITLDFGITKADNEWTTKPGIVGWTYGETANAPVYAAKFGDVKVEYKKADGEDSTYTSTAPTNAGDYKVRFTVAATDDFGGISEVIDLNIARANVAVTAPTAKENLVYTGFAQPLTAGGSTDGGEIRYSSSKDGAYSAEVITGTNAGSYEIWYKVIGDSNHNDTEPVKINVLIAKASVSIPSVENKVYTGNVQTATISDTEYYTVSDNNGGTNVGKYDVKLLLKDSANYHWNGKADDVSEITLDFGITKADNEWTTKPGIVGWTYGETANAPVYAAKFGDVKVEYKKADGEDSTYTTTAPTNAGDYKVRFTVAATDDFEGLSEIIGLNIAKAAQSAPSSVTAVNETIKGKSDGKIIGVNSTMEYKAEGAREYTDVYGSEIANLAAGKYKVRYKKTDNYLAGSDKTIEISEGEMITVNFDSNGGTAVDSKMCEYNRTITAPESEPTKDGYEFVGWFADSEFMTEWNFGTDTFTENKTLYAKWVQGTVSADESDVDEITAEGLNDVAKAEKTSISLAVRTQEASNDSESQTAIKNTPDAPGNFEFYDISVKKSSGEAITETSSVIEIKLPYDFKKKRNIKVYRYHSGNAQELTQLTERNTAKPFDDGTCFVDTENGCIYIYSSKFSTYAAAYDALSSGRGSSTKSSYTVRFETNGADSVSAQTIEKNGVAKEPAVPVKDGYIFDGWYVSNDFSEKYDFGTKVTKNITLYAKWAEKQTEPTKPDADKWNNPFVDVSENDWFYNNVKYAVQNELFSGTTATTFEPNTPITRGMVVTVLYRAEGDPAVNNSVPFADVKADSYYANAVVWAEQNGIVMGTSETTFAPNDNITREQLAAIMLRFAKYKGYDTSISENTNILSFDDFADISEYAIPAMQFAAGAGLINGKSATTLNPKDGATRAEAAAILYRFLTGNNL